MTTYSIPSKKFKSLLSQLEEWRGEEVRQDEEPRFVVVLALESPVAQPPNSGIGGKTMSFDCPKCGGALKVLG